jgi:isoleucyl-tRNA synthetase
VHPEFTYALVDTGERLLLLADRAGRSLPGPLRLQADVLATAPGARWS